MDSLELKEWAEYHCISDDIPTTEVFEERDITVVFKTSDDKSHTVTLLSHECEFCVECNKFGYPLHDEISDAEEQAYFDECMRKGSSFQQEIIDKLYETQVVFSVNENLTITSIDEVRMATDFEASCELEIYKKNLLMFQIGNQEWNKVANKVYRFKSNDKWLVDKEKYHTLHESVKTILKLMTDFYYCDDVISLIVKEIDKIIYG